MISCAHWRSVFPEASPISLLQRVAAMLASVLALGISSLADAAEVVKTPHVEAQLVARHTTFQPGKPIEAALRGPCLKVSRRAKFSGRTRKNFHSAR